MTDPREFRILARRVFMTRGCGVLAACMTAPLWNILAGCNDATDSGETGPFTVAVAELPLNRRVRLEKDGRAVEVVRTESGVTARSLLCTHQGCNVRWEPKSGVYFCPCHDGQFSADGKPLYGPPREPLRDLTVTLTPTEAIIGD